MSTALAYNHVPAREELATSEWYSLLYEVKIRSTVARALMHSGCKALGIERGGLVPVLILECKTMFRFDQLTEVDTRFAVQAAARAAFHDRRLVVWFQIAETATGSSRRKRLTRSRDPWQSSHRGSDSLF